MANNAVLSTLHNQYLSTYQPLKGNSRYDTHKRSELRNIYNSMISVNKDAPLYKFDTSIESKNYIVGLKEASRALHNTFVAVAGSADSDSLDGKIAYSTDEHVVSAKYIGTIDSDESSNETEKADAPTYDIEVKSLASSQVNLGAFVPKNGSALKPGDYSFDLTVDGQGYEFQYSVHDGDENIDIQNRLSRLINKSGIKLNSSVIEDEEGNSALRIESTHTGFVSDKDTQVFRIADSVNPKLAGTVAHFGIDYVAREASNAQVLINNTELTSSSNTFILDSQYEVTLNNISEEGAKAQIGVKADTEAIVQNITNLVDGYNDFVNSLSSFETSHARNNALLDEMKAIKNTFRYDLEEYGLTSNEDGTLSIDKDDLTKTVASKGPDELKGFTDSVLRKSSDVSLNPIAYLNKTVVAYKNPGKTFSSPYTSSAYSGCLFNYYC